MGKENIFSKAHTLLELEDMYMIVLKKKQFSEEMLEQDYAEMRKKLLGTVEIEEQVSKRKTSPIKSITGYTNSKLELSLAWVKGNTELPSFNPVLSHERYSFPSSTIVIYDLVTNGAYFRDYIPSIQNNKLVIKISNKMREIVNIEQDIEIRIEEGEEVQLTEGYYSENYITERIIGKNSIAVVQTLLINPNTNHIKWKIISMFAYHNNELEQIKFTTD